MSLKQPELVVDCQAELGEGAIWDAQLGVLYWVDILGKKFWRLNPATDAQDCFEIDQMIGTIVPRQRGGVMLALEHGFASYDLQTRKLTMICDPENKNPQLRFNDGKCDPAGRFWAGTMPLASADPIGTLFCLYPDLHVEKKVAQVACSNGIVWTADQRTMYFIDTGLSRVDAFDYDVATGAISNRRIAITIPSPMGYPDGSTLDAEGMLWIAHFGGACVTRWNPKTGQHLETVKLPTSNITSCAFGGPQLDRLYVTSARVALKPEQAAVEPHAGGLFCVAVGVKGVPASEFAG